MGVGPIRGGGNRGGAKGAGKANGSAGGKGAVGKAGGATFGKTDATQGLLGPSREVSSAGVGGAEAVEQTTAKEIAKALKSGEIKSKADAARKLVATILKERMAVQSKALETLIAEKLIDDPRLQQTLERIWQKGG
ncbi:MAG TPA: hypothetical protein VGK67_38460 [Myxococcales bacterium]|jgi:hypothetical protein